MLLTIFLAIVFCGAATLFLVSAVAFAEFEKFFSSAPKEVQGVIKPREHELFYGSKGCSGWKNRAWNNKNQAARLALYPVLCVAQAYILTREKSNG